MQTTVNFVKVGERIRIAREEQHLTQAELGHKCGCTNNHLSHLETGQSKPSITMLLRLSNALGKDLNYFILDTPYVMPTCVINTEIARKLEQCSAMTLNTVNGILDVLLAQQSAYNSDHNV